MSMNPRLSAPPLPVSPSPGWLRALAARAATLHERRSPAFVPCPTPAERVEARLERWREYAAAGDSDAFERVLAWQGLSLAEARTLVQDVQLAPGAPLPGWAAEVGALLSAAQRVRPEATARLHHEGAAVAFQEVVSPLVVVARAWLQDRVGPRVEQLTPHAWDQVERLLLHNLAHAASKVLGVDFSLYRHRRRSSLSQLLRRAAGERSDQLYQGFVNAIHSEGLVALVDRWPVLARVIYSLVRGWIDHHAELIERLARDAQALAGQFFDGAPLGTVRHLRGGLSDRHHHGRTVAVLTFSEGRQVVYKPRSLEMDVAFSRFLDALQDLGAPFDLQAPSVLQRDGYGWMACVVPHPCTSTEDARRFYYRSGALLCVLHLLETTDCHHENVMASGDMPVLVDGESVLHHRHAHADGEDGSATHRALRQMGESPLRVGLLPSWKQGADGRAMDTSGLGADGAQRSIVDYPVLQDVNSDHMRITRQALPVRREPNLPVVDGQRVSVVDHGDALEAGFTEAWRFIQRHRAHVVAEGGPLDTFRGCVARYIARPTQLYGDLINGGYGSERMASGLAWSLFHQYLLRPFAARQTPAPQVALVPSELRSLEVLDVPLFLASVDGLGAQGPGLDDAAAVAREPSLERARERIATLSEADLARDLGIIRSTLYCRQAGAPRRHAPVPDPGREEGVDGPVDLVDEARRLGERLAQDAIRGDDGSVTWLTCDPMPGGDHLRIRPASRELYSGVSGIALFFAGLWRVDPDPRWRALALGAVQPLRPSEDEDDTRLGQLSQSIGGVCGLGSITYALAVMSALLDEPSLAADAGRVGRQITAERIADDTMLDVIGGSAGAILALLSAATVVPEPRDLEEAARRCGAHLLAQEGTDPELGCPGYRTIDPARCLCGLSHGAAGIGLALAQLAKHTGDPAFAEGARRALVLEDLAYRPHHGEWLDRRSHRSAVGEERFMTSWCHGAPGIVLSRCAMLRHRLSGDRELLQAVVRRGVDGTLRGGLGGIDNLCCGAVGRAEALLVAGECLGQARWVEAGRRTLRAVVNRGSRVGYSCLAGAPDDVPQPGFYTGLAGIGYHLLRGEHPDLLPSVASFEARV